MSDLADKIAIAEAQQVIRTARNYLLFLTDNESWNKRYGTKIYDMFGSTIIPPPPPPFPPSRQAIDDAERLLEAHGLLAAEMA